MNNLSERPVVERLRPALRWEAGLAVVVAGILIIGSAASPQFLTGNNLFGLGLSNGEIAIMTLPMTLIIISGEIDLSVASILGMSSALLGYLFYLDWKMTLLATVTFAMSALLVRTIHRRLKALGARAFESQLRLVSVVDDIARAWRVVRTFDAGEWEKRRFDTEARHLQRMTIKSTAAGAMMTSAIEACASIARAPAPRPDSTQAWFTEPVCT